VKSPLVVVLLVACSSGAGGGEVPDAGIDAQVRTDAGAGPDAAADAGPPDCAEDRAAFWTTTLPIECDGRRTCIDADERFWVDGAPFVPRGVYNGGADVARVFANCPPAEDCEETTPADYRAYVAMLAEAGFNLIQERSRFTPELADAVHEDPTVRFAHLLWSDPFTVEGHDSIVEDVEAAAADPDVVFWFGPDEVDFNDDWPTAAGIRRILFGDDRDLDGLLRGEYAPDGDPYLPDHEPAHDPHGLPFGAALTWDWGLADGRRVYDVLMPITYPFETATSAANEGQWGTWRIADLETRGAPVVPVLQMLGIPVMGLRHPSPAQVRAEIASAMANGARGAFYYTMVSDQPSFGGRDGWFAPDDRESWAVYTEMHALQDSLLPVTHGPATATSGTGGALEWRTWQKGARRVVLVVNPTSEPEALDLAGLVGDVGAVRTWTDCATVSPPPVSLAAYAHLVMEAL
jgi:hypothetical protein